MASFFGNLKKRVKEFKENVERFSINIKRRLEDVFINFNRSAEDLVKGEPGLLKKGKRFFEDTDRKAERFFEDTDRKAEKIEKKVGRGFKSFFGKATDNDNKAIKKNKKTLEEKARKKVQSQKKTTNKSKGIFG